MKYMLLIYGNPASWATFPPGSEAYAALMQTHKDLIKDLEKSGELVDNSALTTADARIVRTANDETVVTDGPFTEAKEVLAGYYLIDCESLDRAVAIAARLPEVKYDLVEVRQAMDPPDPDDL